MPGQRDRKNAAVEISFGVDQTGNVVARRDRPPSIVFPFTGQSQMETDVVLGMFLGPGNELTEPRAENWS